MDDGAHMIDDIGKTIFSPETVSLFVVLLIIYSVLRNKGSSHRTRRRRKVRKRRERGTNAS